MIPWLKAAGARALRTALVTLLPLLPMLMVGVDVEIDLSHVRPPQAGAVRLGEPVCEATVGAFRLFPGLSPDLLRNVLQAPLQGLVLLAYGVGNGPELWAAAGTVLGLVGAVLLRRWSVKSD